MSVRRALVDFAVLSLQDSCVYYPCCKCCSSRIDTEPQDTSRCRCFKCGYSCLREKVDYRYRLSLKVTRNKSIFGVTVFGTCLNSFFGIPASGFKRLVDNIDGTVVASTRSTLLVKAVEDCFIGRHFIFGIKVTGTENELWSGGPVANGCNCRDTVQFIASQMLLPRATEHTGCTVLSYYRVVLQRAEEHELGFTDDSKSSKAPRTTLLLLPVHSPGRTFNNTTFSASGFLSQLLQRSQHHDCSLTLTPPWQQSLGLITSSAEQDDSVSTQEGGEENSRLTNYSKTPHLALRTCLVNHKLRQETTLSPLLSYNRLSFSTYPDVSIENSIVNTPTLDRWYSPSQSIKKVLPLSCNTKELCSTQLAKTFLSSSLAWDDLAFSESLTQFLCENESDSQTKPLPNVQNVAKRARHNLENGSKNKKHNSQIMVNQSWPLADISNTSAFSNGGDGHDLSASVCKNSVCCVKNSKARSVCTNESNQHDVVVSSLSFENEEELLEGDTYNCSADLFSSSFMADMSTTLNTHTEAIRMDADGCALLSNPDTLTLRSELPSVLHLTPSKHKMEGYKCISRDNLIPPVSEERDFTPPSQSTPNVKLAVVSGPPASMRFSLGLGEIGLQLGSQDLCALTGNLSGLENKSRAEITSSICKPKTVSSNHLCARDSVKEKLVWSTTFRAWNGSRGSHRFTPERRIWKSHQHRQYLLAQQRRSVRREAPNLGPNERISRKPDSSVCNATVHDYEDNEVPPTPVVKTQLTMELRRRQLSSNNNNSIIHFESTCECQKGAGVNCKRTLLHPAVTLLQRSTAQTGNCDGEVIYGGRSDGPHGYLLNDEDQACDCSRDLFSDSF